VVRLVGIQPAFDGTGRDRKSAATCRSLDRLEVQPIDTVGSYERFDLGDDLRVEERFEPPFLATSSEAASGGSTIASAHCSHADQKASTVLRNCRPAST
jgi:hypothetical protein